MFEQNPIMTLLLENCETFSDRRELFSLTEAEVNNVNNNMVNKLFDSAVSKAHVDFDDIPKSKGDISKYTGYKPMVECLNTLRNIAIKSGHKIPEIDIVEKALDNIVAYRDQFERGFKLNKDYVILQYNTLVMSCVIATSSLISSYVEYIKRIDKIEFSIINPKGYPGDTCITNLSKFNRSVSSGDFAKAMKAIITSDGQNFTGGVMAGIGLAITGLVVGAFFMRDIVFYIYYSRVKIADYLRVQSLFLELNKNNINSQSYDATPEKKEKILRKQEELIIKLNKAADKIDISDQVAVNKMKTEIKKENSGWKLDDVKGGATDTSGFQLI